MCVFFSVCTDKKKVDSGKSSNINILETTPVALQSAPHIQTHVCLLSIQGHGSKDTTVHKKREYWNEKLCLEMKRIIWIIKQPSDISKMTSNVNSRVQREIRFQLNCKQGHVCTLYIITICLFLIFAEACMFWEESILAAVTSLSLGLEANLLYIPTCNAFVSF